MATSVNGLISKFRDQMDDSELPHFWSDDRIVEWFDEAQREFARATHIFKDSFPLVVTAGDPYVTMPDNLLEYRSGRSDIQKRNITNINFNELHSQSAADDYGQSLLGDWMDATGNPVTISLDVIAGMGRLVPIPTTDDTITMFYTRYPLKTITASSSKTELTKPEHQNMLVLYARVMGYDDNDSDTFSPNTAAKLMAEFLKKMDMYTAQIKNSTRRAGTVKYGGL